MADSIIGKISVGDGATFTPSISSAGVLSFTNNKNLPNPAPFDIPAKVLEEGESTLRGLVSDAETAEQNASDSAYAAANSAAAAEDAARRAESFTPEGFEARVEALETQVPINTANIAQNAGGISANSKRISNVEKLLQGNLYDYQTDDTVAYTKTVPAGAMPYAGLERVGGKTVVWNQYWYIQNSATITDSGITIQRNTDDNSVTVTGTATASKTIWNVIYTITGTTNDKLIDGHKYAVVFNSQDVGVRLGYESASANHKSSYIITGTGVDYSHALGIVIVNGETYNSTMYPMLIDLTRMFGSGNEPTIDEFKAMYPAEYYEATVGELVSAGVTEVVSKKADTSTIATYSIPAEIQSLDGYGWSAGNAYNYIDFERKVFVKNVDRVDLGTLSYSSSSTTGHRYFYSGGLSNVIKYVAGTNAKVNNIVCDKYIAGSFSDAYNGAFNCIGVGGNLVSTGRIGIYDSTKEEMTNAEFKASVSGVYAYYELATPQEIDISAYLTDDNLIEVESGGTLTFPNANGDNYKIPVPSSVTYMVNLQEAINNG